MTFPEAIDWLSTKTLTDRTFFIKLFLSDLTIMNRAIWDDHTTSNETKIECLKWSNELSHRIWNLLFELEKGQDDYSTTKLAENLRFYQQQSKELSGHLAASFKGTVEVFNSLKNR
tara:strand:+ start:246 stop:593 length:348 start_codon:yes stop_codon:yes gene_type:complete